MTKQLYPIIILLLLLIGCQSKFQSFQHKALAFAKNDNRIDQKEYKTLIDDISNSSGRGFRQFKTRNGQIDNTQVVSYLLKYFKASHLKLSASDIWQSNTANGKVITFNINVFLENSGSMDGYVNGVTSFENSIYSLLGNLENGDFSDSINLYYINESIPYSIKNATNTDIKNFIEGLEPTTFKERGGKRGDTNIGKLLKRATDKVNDNNLTVLISDFIFSPNKESKDIVQVLQRQKINIQNIFAKKLKSSNLSIVVLQLQSKFNGLYYTYDHPHKGIRIDCERPYYIWFIGTDNQIRKLINSSTFNRIDGGYQHKLVFKTTKQITPNFKISYSPRIGSFDAGGLSNGIIKDAEPSDRNQNKGVFGFNLAVDFSNILKDSNYFLNPNNYVLSDDNYHISIKPIKDKNNIALKGFTYLLELQTKNLKNEDLKIELIGKLPSWVYNSSSDDDLNIRNDTSEQSKTFGLKYMMEGVSSAFKDKKDNSLSSLQIKIETIRHSVNWYWVIIPIIILIVIILLVIKNKKD